MQRFVMWKIYYFSSVKNCKLIFLLTCLIITWSCTADYQRCDAGDIKYILLWNPKGILKYWFGEGQEVFLRNGCPIDNCFVTSDRQMFGEYLWYFDAILFAGWDNNWFFKDDLPDNRYYHQKYTYLQTVSAARSYVCHTGFNNFFNWTMTYKLDSDIVFPHLHISDVNEDIVGPKKDMQWIKFKDMSKVDDELAIRLQTKKKAIAWFNSKCEQSNDNRKIVDYLQRALNKYSLVIDIYGKCGSLHCLKHECDKLLEKHYYFCLVIEDSFAEDYVTGLLTRPLRNSAVPIVYGGANYSRFLPPKSYLDGTTHTAEELAYRINKLVNNQTLYTEYFRWRSHYSYCSSLSLSRSEEESCGQSMCNLCQALHDPNKYFIRSTYKNFRKWWYPDYIHKCPH